MKRQKVILFITVLLASLSLIAQPEKSIHLSKAGTLKDSINSADMQTVSKLTLTGMVDARDFAFMRDSLTKLDTLNIRDVTIGAFSGKNILFEFFREYNANEIPDFAFYYNKAIKEIILPTSIKSIGENAFRNSALKKVIIPNSVQSIEEFAFSGTDAEYMFLSGALDKIEMGGIEFQKTKAIYFPATAPVDISGSSMTFLYRSSCVLYVPKGFSSNFLSDSDWSKFKEIKELDGVSIEDSTYLLNKDSSSISYTVLSNSKWSASSDQDWVKIIYDNKQTGIDNFEIRIPENTDTLIRYATVTITPDTGAIKTLHISQGGSNAYFKKSSYPKTIDGTKDTTIVLKIESNTTWKVTSAYSTFPLLMDEGTYIGNDSITITFLKNETNVSRIAGISFRFEDNDIHGKTLDITQTPGTTELVSVSDSTVALPFTNYGWESVDVEVYSDLDLTIEDNTDWLKGSLTRWEDHYTLTLNTLGEESETALTGIISLIADGITYKTITVTQEPGCYFCNKLDTVYLTERQIIDGKLVNYIYHFPKFRYQPDWLQSYTECISHDLDCFTTIYAELNSSNTTRIGSIRLYSSYSYKTATIVQPPTTESLLSVSRQSFNIPAQNFVLKPLVISNIDWTATSDQPWIKITDGNEGTGCDSIIFITTENTTYNQRTGDITVSGEGVVDQIITITQEAAPKPLPLTISPSEITFASEPDSLQSVTVKTNTEWSATASQTWLSISTTDSSILVIADTNTIASNRYATITVKNADAITETISVKQNGTTESMNYFYSIFDGDTICFSTGTTFSNAIISTTSWEAVVGDEWLSISPNSGVGDTTMSWINYDLTVSANPNVYARYSTLSFFVDGKSQRTFVVKQEAGIPELKVSSNSIELNNKADSTSITINASTNWTAISEQEWLTIEKTNDNTIIISANINNSTNKRFATILVEDSKGNTELITVTQNATGCISLSDTLFTTLDIETVLEVIVKSNENWYSTETCPWITTISDSAGTGNNDTLRLHIAQNTTNESRTDIVFISALECPADDYYKKIKIIQETAPKLTISSDSVELNNKADSTSITINASTNWTAISEQEWLTIEKTNDNTIIISANINNSTNKRFATILVEDSKGNTELITVTQNATGCISLSDTLFTTLDIETVLEVIVKSNENWYSTETCPWIATISDSAGTGNNDTLRLHIAQNTTNESRTDIVFISALECPADDYYKKIKIIQETAPKLTVSSDSIELNNKANSTANITVNSNTVWTAVSNQEWLDININDNTIEVFATENTTTESRVATISISANGINDKLISIIQTPEQLTGLENTGAIIVSPNPAKEYFKINITDKAFIQLMNTVGRTVYEKNIKGEELIPTKSIPAGAYILRITKNNSIETTTLIIKQ